MMMNINKMTYFDFVKIVDSTWSDRSGGLVRSSDWISNLVAANHY